MMSESGDYKSDIVVTHHVQAIKKQNNRFDIIDNRSGMILQFTIIGTEDAEQWVSKINRVIQSHTQ